MFLHAIIPDWWCRHPALSTTLALRGPRPLRGLLPQRDQVNIYAETLFKHVKCAYVTTEACFPKLFEETYRTRSVLHMF
jgi:hypothetical protein